MQNLSGATHQAQELRLDTDRSSHRLGHEFMTLMELQGRQRHMVYNAIVNETEFEPQIKNVANNPILTELTIDLFLRG